ncbi:hypothetical protein [Fodinicola feengrottensis]|uniref:hypothetical protein n=1 Tax=Fodinicola feengrottensis TaxID=435914 RepID=UPI002441C2FE|nr:hypothetical protein [Fodinicola feengrottensis]
MPELAVGAPKGSRLVLPVREPVVVGSTAPVMSLCWSASSKRPVAPGRSLMGLPAGSLLIRDDPPLPVGTVTGVLVGPS